ncbi:MAG: hypothetical protein R8L58_07595 [Mariprofundaceae bacterium]
MSISGRQIFGVSRRSLSRLMAGLFAMQVVVAGFCLLTADAHAASHQMTAQQSADMAEHCAKSATHDAGHHSDSCFHCDDSDVFVKAASIDVPSFNPVLSVVASMPEAPAWITATVAVSRLMPTGPPRSASLLFSTTQRIRV